MPENVIAIEDRNGPFKPLFQRIMRMVPDKDKGDVNLQRLLAFRLEIDGEAATVEYLMRKIRDLIHCSYTGSLYSFLKDDRIARDCLDSFNHTDPPEIA
jgi:hypothetical protein